MDGEEGRAGGTRNNEIDKKSSSGENKDLSSKGNSSRESDSTALGALIAVFALVFIIVVVFAIKIYRKLRRKQKESKNTVIAEGLSKNTECSNGLTEQIEIEPKSSVVSFSRQRMISNSSGISSLSQLLFSDGPRQKEFSGDLCFI